MKRHKVVLVSAGVSRREYSQFARFMPLTAPGVHYIKATLEEQGYPVKIINQTNDNLTNEETIKQIEKENPNCVLFNQFFSTRGKVRDIIRHLDNKYIFGVGGHDPTFNSLVLPKERLQREYKEFDFVWRGEAETKIADFLQNFKNKAIEPLFIDNLKNRSLNLDKLPILDHGDYSGDIGFLVSSRGCLCNGCDFCTTPAFYKEGRRQRSFENVSLELENLVKAGKKYVFICDDNFLGFSLEDLQRGDRILHKCNELELKVMIMTTKEQILNASENDLLKNWRGTLFRVFLGIENADENALKRLGKKCDFPTNKEKSEKAISALYNNGISLFAGYINFNPWSTFEELEKSANFLFENGMESANFTNLSQGLRFYEGTKLFDRISGKRIPFEICNGEYVYQFQDERVGKLFRALQEQRKITDILDNLNYETTDLVYINQLSDSKEGEEYNLLRSKINENNYRFFMQSLQRCKEGDTNIYAERESFIKKTLELTKSYEELHSKILKKSIYS